MKKILTYVLVLITIFVFNVTAFASGDILGREFNFYGTIIYGYADYRSHDEITSDMSPGGVLYATDTKASALVNPAAICTVDRVRCYPENSTSDLRIDPNYESNWVGPYQANGDKQVKAVQTILGPMGYYPGDIDGICGQETIDAIWFFQDARNLPTDEIVGPNTWRALCSAQYFSYGTSIWGLTSPM